MCMVQPSSGTYMTQPSDDTYMGMGQTSVDIYIDLHETVDGINQATFFQTLEYPQKNKC